MSFNIVPLGSLVKRKIGYGIVQPGASVRGGVPVIKVNNIISGLKSISDLDTTKKETDSQYTRTKLQGGELIISIVGTIGKTAIVPKSFAGCNLVRATGLIDIPDTTLTKWVKYYIDSPKGQAYIVQNLNTTVQPTLNIKSLVEMPIPIPDELTMKKVVGVLSCLDAKIELNNRINDNLEQQAQALFKSWFIDYTPFGSYVPSDWNSTTLGSVCRCELGGTPSRVKPEYWNGNIPWINSGEVNRFRITQPSEKITELGLSKSATKLLPKKTTVIAITGVTLGQVSLLEIDVCANQSVVGVVPNCQLPYEFIYPFIKANIQELISHQTGGAQQHINKQNVESLPVIVPPESALNSYVSSVNNLYGLIANNCFENERLVEMRDTLLPKLMSGELDLSEVEI